MADRCFWTKSAIWSWILAEEVEKGRFRQDLFYRINVVNLKPLPLRERPEDIPMLTDYFLNSYNEAYNGKAQPLSPQVLQLMQRHSWPGNIRELENLIRRYVIMGTEDAITSELVVHKMHTRAPDIPPDGKISLKQVTRDVVQQVEREVIHKVLQSQNWNRKRAARALGISYRALLYKIREAGLPSRNVLRRAAAIPKTDLA
jgi:two-component system response regulator AtoC